MGEQQQQLLERGNGLGHGGEDDFLLPPLNSDNRRVSQDLDQLLPPASRLQLDLQPSQLREARHPEESRRVSSPRFCFHFIAAA